MAQDHYDFAFSPDPVNEDPFAEQTSAQDSTPAAEDPFAAQAPTPSTPTIAVTEAKSTTPLASLAAAGSPVPSPRVAPNASPRASPQMSPQPSPRLQPSPKASPRPGAPSPRGGPPADDLFEMAPAAGQDDLKFEGKQPDCVATPESNVLAQWQAKRQEELRKRRDAAREKKEQQKETAKEEVAKFLADREAKIQKTKVTNVEEEKNFTTDMATLMEHGSQWEKVHKLINLQPKPNEKPGTSRKDRMRALLIQLKHEK